MWINGTQIGIDNSDIPASIDNSPTSFRLGISEQTADKPYNGLIDEVGVWSKALSDDEVADLYNSGDGLPYSLGGLSKKSFSDGDYVYESNPVPTKYKLHTNYPNPFNPTTTIKYDLPEDTQVKLVIYNILGQKVATLVDGFKEAGYHQAIWQGNNLSSGLYFYQFQTKKFTQIKKMLLVK